MQTAQAQPAQSETVINLKTKSAVSKAAHHLRAFNHRLRQQILQHIESKGELKVTELYVHLRMEQSVASQHLGILRNAGLVNTRRDGKFIYYSVNFDRLHAVTELCDRINRY